MIEKNWNEKDHEEFENNRVNIRRNEKKTI